eukprot:SAG22_NODE_4581_length_1226_cov_1.081633_2_plen_58_part_00
MLEESSADPERLVDRVPGEEHDDAVVVVPPRRVAQVGEEPQSLIGVSDADVCEYRAW